MKSVTNSGVKSHTVVSNKLYYEMNVPIIIDKFNERQDAVFLCMDVVQ